MHPVHSLDQLHHARARPQIGGKILRQRTRQEPSPQTRPLNGAQFRGRSRRRLDPQSGLAPKTKRLLPASDRPRIDSQMRADLRRAVPFFLQRHRFPTTTLPLFGRPWRFHAATYHTSTM
jgi:hypothetical protein